jgi:hypothetical protein
MLAVRYVLHLARTEAQHSAETAHRGGERSSTTPGSMHKSSTTNDTSITVLLCLFSSKGGSSRTSKTPPLSYFPSLPSPRLPWPWTGDPFSARSSPLEVLAFQSSISLTGRQPLPESRVGGISSFWTAESHARSRVTGEKNHPSPFGYACLPPRVKEIISSTSSKAKPGISSLHLPLSVASRPRPITSRRDTRLTTMQAL